jgi:hypothetical protein
MTEHHHRMSIHHPVIVRPNGAPDDRVHGKQREVVAGHELSLDARFRTTVDGDVDRRGGVAGERGHRVAVAQQAVFLVGEPAREVGAVLLSDREQAFRVADREHSPQDGIHQREDRRVGADAEGKRQDDGGCEPRGTAQEPEGVDEVLDDRLGEPLDRGLAAIDGHTGFPLNGAFSALARHC